MIKKIENLKITDKKMLLYGAVIILFLGLLGGLIWSLASYQNIKKQVVRLSSPEGQAELAQQETNILLTKIGQLIILPQGQDPFIATIQDAATLAEKQAFYKDAQNGDKLIVYSDKAFIYREQDNRLVNVGPVFRTPVIDESLIQEDKEETQLQEGE